MAIQSTLDPRRRAAGDGVRGWIVSSRHGVLKSADRPQHAEVEFNVDSLAVEAGDTIDFVVDIRDGLNSDQHLWAAKIRELGDSDGRGHDLGRGTRLRRPAHAAS